MAATEDEVREYIEQLERQHAARIAELERLNRPWRWFFRGFFRGLVGKFEAEDAIALEHSRKARHAARS